MKTILIQAGATAVLSLGLFSCADDASGDAAKTDSVVMADTVVTATAAAPSYVDLATGENVTRDEATGRYTTTSGRSVVFYIDPVQRDTFYALTGEVVNLKLKNVGEGTWEYADKKIKIDEDDIKIEYADGSKVKLEDEEMKIKRADGSKTKIEDDEFKDKNDERKVKVEDDEVKVKDK